MTSYRLYDFFRPTLYVVFSMFLIWSFLPNPAPPQVAKSAVSEKKLESVLATVEAVEQPRPELTPEEVVQIQLDGLASDDVTQGILQCMTFASPNNRAVTGPLVRFAQMVRQPPFDALANPETVLIGQSVFDAEQVRILVTAVREGNVHPFVWVLSKQSVLPYEGCWMTDAVFPLEFERTFGPPNADKPNSI